MGVVIPQVITEDKASGALVIDGSLKFDKNKSQRLQFTPSNSGNRRTWTISYWYKIPILQTLEDNSKQEHQTQISFY